MVNDDDTSTRITRLFYDWKDAPTLDDLRDALEPLGVYVYEDPAFAGTDTYGFLFSREPLGSDAIAAASEEE